MEIVTNTTTAVKNNQKRIIIEPTVRRPPQGPQPASERGFTARPARHFGRGVPHPQLSNRPRPFGFAKQGSCGGCPRNIVHGTAFFWCLVFHWRFRLVHDETQKRNSFSNQKRRSGLPQGPGPISFFTEFDSAASLRKVLVQLVFSQNLILPPACAKSLCS